MPTMENAQDSKDSWKGALSKPDSGVSLISDNDSFHHSSARKFKSPTQNQTDRFNQSQLYRNIKFKERKIVVWETDETLTLEVTREHNLDSTCSVRVITEERAGMAAAKTGVNFSYLNEVIKFKKGQVYPQFIRRANVSCTYHLHTNPVY